MEGVGIFDGVGCGSVGWYFVRVVGSGIGIGSGDEVDSGFYGEV